MTRLRLLLFSSLLLTTSLVQADWSANIGWASEYYYRGILQKSSSASGGVDYEQGGFYAGVWGADVGDGLEVDGYFGYGGEMGDFGYGIGFTGYYYTGDFDDTYQEINLSGSYDIFTLDIAIGEYDNFGGPTADYIYYSLTVEKDGFYGKFGGFSQDLEGNYIELGYGTTIADFDVGFSAIFSDSDLVGESDEALIFSLGKSFDLK